MFFRYTQLREALLKLTEISQVLKAKRLRDGALELETIEVQFEFEDISTGKLEDIKPQKAIYTLLEPHAILQKTKLKINISFLCFFFFQRLMIHETVSEFMIFTNCWVAKKILHFFPGHALVSLGLISGSHKTTVGFGCACY